MRATENLADRSTSREAEQHVRRVDVLRCLVLEGQRRLVRGGGREESGRGMLDGDEWRQSGGRCLHTIRGVCDVINDVTSDATLLQWCHEV